MASKFAELLINSLLPAIETLGTAKLVEVLQKFHDDKPEDYAIAIVAGHAFVEPLMKLVVTTKTKIDDGFIEALHEAIDISAKANGIEFPGEDVL